MQPLPYWLAVDWKGVAALVTALIAASSPIWLRFIQRKDDVQKRQIDFLVASQDREDKRLEVAYAEAVKERERERKLREVAENVLQHYRNEAYRLEDTARDMRHDLINMQEAYRLSYNRFRRLMAGEMSETEQSKIVAGYTDPNTPVVIVLVSRPPIPSTA